MDAHIASAAAAAAAAALARLCNRQQPAHTRANIRASRPPIPRPADTKQKPLNSLVNGHQSHSLLSSHRSDCGEFGWHVSKFAFQKGGQRIHPPNLAFQEHSPIPPQRVFPSPPPQRKSPQRSCRRSKCNNHSLCRDCASTARDHSPNQTLLSPRPSLTTSGDLPLPTPTPTPTQLRATPPPAQMPAAASGGGTIWVLRPTGLYKSSAIPAQPASSSSPTPLWAPVSLPASTTPTVLSATPTHALLGAADGTITAFPHRAHAAPSPVARTAPLSGAVSALAHVPSVGVFAACADGAVVCFAAEVFPGNSSRGRGRAGPALPRYLVHGREGGEADCGVCALAVDADFLYAGGGDGVVTVWNLRSHAREREISLALGAGEVTALLRAGPSTLWVGFADGVVRVWDVCGDDTSGVEEVLLERAHSGSVRKFVHASADEIWSIEDGGGGGDEKPMAWGVRLPRFLGAAHAFESVVGAGRGIREVVEVRRERRERVDLLGLGGDDLDQLAPANLDEPLLARFSPDTGSSVSGVGDGGEAGELDTTVGWPLLVGSDWKPVGELYERAHAATRQLLDAGDTMPPGARAELFQTVQAMAAVTNEHLQRASSVAAASAGKPQVSDASDDDESPGQAKGGADIVTSERGNPSSGSATENRPPGNVASAAPCGGVGPPRPVAEALESSLDHARMLLPSVRLGDQRGPLAKELESATRLLELWKMEGGSHSSVSSDNRDDLSLIARGRTVVSAAEQIERLRVSLEKSRQETGAAKESLREAKEELLCAGDSGRMASNHLKVAEAERDVLKEELDSLHAESSKTVRGLERKLREVSVEIGGLKADVAEAESKLKNEARDRAKLEIEVDGKMGVIESLKRAHRHAENSLLEKSAELAAIETKLDEENHALGDMQREREDAEASNQELQETLAAQVEQLLIATRRTEASQSEVSRLKELLEDCQSDLQGERERIGSLQGQLQVERDAVEKERMMLQGVSRDLEALKLSASDTKAELSAEKRKRKDAEDMFQNQIRTLESMATAVEEKQAIDTADLEEELKEARTLVAALERSIFERDDRLKAKENEASSLEAELMSTREECKFLRLADKTRLAEADKGRSAYASLKEAMDLLKDDFDRSEKRNAELNASLESLRDFQKQAQEQKHEVPASTAGAVVPADADEVHVLRKAVAALERGSRSREKECGELRQTVENRDDELRRLRAAGEKERAVLNSLETKIRDLEAERVTAQEALDCQIAATATVAGQMADKDDLCMGLNARIDELEWTGASNGAMLDGIVDGVSAPAFGEVTSALTETCQGVVDMRRTLESATSMATRLQQCAATHRESLPILLELGRALERSQAEVDQNDGKDNCLESAVNALQSMIALLYSEADKELALSGNDLDEASRLAPTPLRAAELQSQVATWRTERLLEQSPRAASTPAGTRLDANPLSDEPDASSRWTPRRFLQF